MNLLHCINMHCLLLCACFIYVASLLVFVPVRINSQYTPYSSFFRRGPQYIYGYLSCIYVYYNFFSFEVVQKLAILLSLVSMYNPRLVYDKTDMTCMCINNCWAWQMFYVLLYPFVLSINYDICIIIYYFTA
jgi:hypothetical protein